MEGKDQTFHLNPITDVEVDELGLSQSDLWMVQINDGEVYGPYSTEMLREDSKVNEELYESCMVYNVVSEQWKSFYTITEFQRRKPKLVPAQSLVKSETFWVLENGQKAGPLTLNELKGKVASKEIVLNQEVSVDEGKTWIKIYEHHAFDRRLRQNQEELPFQPEAEVFINADGETYSKIVSLQQKKEDQSAISGLAFIGRGNDKGQMMAKAVEEKAPSSQPEATVTPFPTVNRGKKFGWKKWAMGFAAAVVVSAGFNSFNTSFNEDDAQLGEIYRGDVRRINNSDRSTRLRKPASVNEKTKKPRVERAKRYEAPSRPQARPHRERPRARTKEREQFKESEKISHSYEDFENLDIDDPRVREELTRELAGEILDQGEEADQIDQNGEYMDNPDYDSGYEVEEEHLPNESAPGYRDEPPYEEISDFE